MYVDMADLITFAIILVLATAAFVDDWHKKMNEANKWQKRMNEADRMEDKWTTKTTEK